MNRSRIKLAAAAAVISLTACSENAGVTAPDASPSFDVVVASGAGWFPMVTPNNYPVGEFWDNLSYDGSHCNVGHYANGPFHNIDPNIGPVGPCLESITANGLPANATTFQANEFYAQNGGVSPAPLMFEAGTYEVTFLDGFRSNGLQPVGYFTKTGSVYNFVPISPAVSSVVNGTVTFTTTSDWGFWIQPSDPVVGGCALGIMCSDDPNIQQFAAFRRIADGTFLVGIEDQAGVGTTPALTPAGGDKDFNDFFLSVREVSTEEVLQGRMTGGVGNKAADVSVSITIHCDNELSNNIQIQGPNKLNWHLDKNSLTNVICMLTNNPAPPVAPINVFSGSATGTLNGVPGSSLQFTFVDNGEPGKADTFSLKIWNASNVVVLDVTNLTVTQGNLQAHFDQPHKNK